MAAFSASLRWASGSGGSSERPRVSKAPASTAIFSLDGEWSLSSLAWSKVRFSMMVPLFRTGGRFLRGNSDEGEWRREKGEGRREKGEGRKAKGERRDDLYWRSRDPSPRQFLFMNVDILPTYLRLYNTSVLSRSTIFSLACPRCPQISSCECDGINDNPLHRRVLIGFPAATPRPGTDSLPRVCFNCLNA